MMKQRRLVNSADNFRTTGNQSPKTKKRVRFLDHSFAQELIGREKARLEEKIKSLRQAYDFRQTVSGNGEPITDSQNNVHTQERRDSGVPKKDEEDEDEEDTNSNKKAREAPRTRIDRRGLLSAERLAELSKPKSKSGTLSTNSSRRNAIVTASPEHLKLSIPERSPRTIPQLRRLSGDEVDYLVQPKTLHEFQSLTEISFPPSKCLRNSGRGPRPMGNGSHQQTGQFSFSARGFKSKNSSNHLDSVRVINADSSKQNSPSKSSFKMAALGVLSMKTQEREDLAPKSNQIRISDLFTKSLPPKLALQQRAKSSVVASFDKQLDVPGGRVLRLRPRKSAWLELRINSMNLTTTTQSQQDTSVDKPKDTVSPETQEKMVSTASSFTSSVKYHNWKDHKFVNVDELTKNLSKCSYLRGVDEEMDIL